MASRTPLDGFDIPPLVKTDFYFHVMVAPIDQGFGFGGSFLRWLQTQHAHHRYFRPTGAADEIHQRSLQLFRQQVPERLFYGELRLKIGPENLLDLVQNWLNTDKTPILHSGKQQGLNQRLRGQRRFADDGHRRHVTVSHRAVGVSNSDDRRFDVAFRITGRFPRYGSAQNRAPGLYGLDGEN
jgi:hypothetical protein